MLNVITFCQGAEERQYYDTASYYGLAANPMASYYDLMNYGQLMPYATTLSLPFGYQAYMPTADILSAYPPMYSNYQLVCDTYNTYYCYYYYY